MYHIKYGKFVYLTTAPCGILVLLLKILKYHKFMVFVLFCFCTVGSYRWVSSSYQKAWRCCLLWFDMQAWRDRSCGHCNRYPFFLGQGGLFSWHHWSCRAFSKGNLNIWSVIHYKYVDLAQMVMDLSSLHRNTYLIFTKYFKRNRCYQTKYAYWNNFSSMHALQNIEYIMFCFLTISVWQSLFGRVKHDILKLFRGIHQISSPFLVISKVKFSGAFVLTFWIWIANFVLI